MFNERKREAAVADFMAAAGVTTYEDRPEKIGMVLSCLMEEVTELLDAVTDYRTKPSPETRASLCKEWADAQYVLSQLAVYFSIPADASFNRVHESNMSKVVDGKIRSREDGKVLKPEGYKPPDMTGL